MRSRRIIVSEVSKRKRGQCRLCSEHRVLTWTHVPSKSAGNVGMARPPVVITDEAGREAYGLGEERLGGIREYWFCAECNNRTNEWDKAFVRMTQPPLQALHDPGLPGNTFEATIFEAAMGEFVRCLWAWMFAVGENLRAQLPDVAAAVRSGDAVEAPDAPRLFVGVTRDVQIGIQALPSSIIVTAPPYVAVLLSQRAMDAGGSMGLFDTGPWLRYPAGARPTVTMRTVIVDPGPFPMIGEPVVN